MSNAKDTVALALKDIRALAREIRTRREAALRKRIRHRERRSIWASSIPSCLRQGVYEFTHWDKKRLHGLWLQARFNKGNQEEDALVIELKLLGFQVVEEQTSLDPKFTKKYKIGAYIDLKVRWGSRRVLVEIKSCHPNIFPNIKTAQDLKRSAFHRKWYRQFMIYLAGTGQHVGLIIITDCLGHWKILVVQLDQKELEASLEIVKALKRFIARKKLPDRIEYNDDLCGRCAFKRVCKPKSDADKIMAGTGQGRRGPKIPMSGKAAMSAPDSLDIACRELPEFVGV